MVRFQTSAFKSRHRWKFASSTFFFNEFVYRTVPVVLLILYVHCFAVKPAHHHCHIMQQKAFTFHMTYVLVLFQDNYWPAGIGVGIYDLVQSEVAFSP